MSFCRGGSGTAAVDFLFGDEDDSLAAAAFDFDPITGQHGQKCMTTALEPARVFLFNSFFHHNVQPAKICILILIRNISAEQGSDFNVSVQKSKR